jgi:zinc protease
MVWPTVGSNHEDSRALRALSQLLTQDRTSRLTRALVYERQLATSVMTFQGSDALAGEFFVSVTPRADASLTDIENVVDSVIAEISATPPTEREVRRFKNFVAVSAVTGLQSVLGKSEAISQGQTFFGDPLHYITDARETLAVTPEDVHRVARMYLGRGRVVLSMVPAGKLDMVSRPDRPFVNVTPSALP